MKELNNYPLWTALITPFHENGDIDFESFTTLLKQQEKAQNAILLLGSTGEALSLSLEERKQVVQFATQLKLCVPLMVGVGGINLKEQLQWVDFLNTHEIDTYLLVTPLYSKPGTQGQIEWFKQLLDKSKRPCMLYNVPSRCGVKMSFEAVESLKDHSQFWALKEASGSIEEFDRYHQSAPSVLMYSGDDGLLVDFCKNSKCSGLVSVASNVWPEATHLYTKKSVNNNFDGLENWPQWCDTLFLASNPIPAKALAKEIGLIKNAILRPPLTQKDLSSTQPLLKANQEVAQWLGENK